MKLKNGDIFLARQPLLKLLEMSLPVKASLQVAKLANKLNEQLKIIDDVRNGLIRKYGAPDQKERGQLRVDPETEGFEKFLADFNELMEQDVEMVLEKVKLPTEVDGKPLQIEPSVLMGLEKFVDVEG